MDKHIEIVTRSTSVLSNQPIFVCLLNCSLQNRRLVVKFATNVDICSCAVHASASNQTSFDELVWVFSHNFSVLAGSRLSLISVYDQISWLIVLIPVLEIHK